MLIALTGGIACGKSTAAKLFGEHGFEILDADKLAHKLLENSPEVRAAVIALLGAESYSKDSLPDRAYIAGRVFKDRKLLDCLENILHPAVIEECVSRSGQKNRLVEIPLLFEKKLESRFDLCIDVFCSESLRRERLRLRGMSDEEMRRRIALQMPQEIKAKLADIVLFNESEISFLKRQIDLVISSI